MAYSIACVLSLLFYFGSPLLCTDASPCEAKSLRKSGNFTPLSLDSFCRFHTRVGDGTYSKPPGSVIICVCTFSSFQKVILLFQLPGWSRQSGRGAPRDLALRAILERLPQDPAIGTFPTRPANQPPRGGTAKAAARLVKNLLSPLSTRSSSIRPVENASAAAGQLYREQGGGFGHGGRPEGRSTVLHGGGRVGVKVAEGKMRGGGARGLDRPPLFVQLFVAVGLARSVRIVWVVSHSYVVGEPFALLSGPWRYCRPRVAGHTVTAVV